MVTLYPVSLLADALEFLPESLEQPKSGAVTSLVLPQFTIYAFLQRSMALQLNLLSTRSAFLGEMKRYSLVDQYSNTTKRARHEFPKQPSDMLSKPYVKISTPKLQALATSKPSISVVWQPSKHTKPSDYRMLIEKIPLDLARAFSTFVCDAAKTLKGSDLDTEHLPQPLILNEGNGKAYKLIFEWIQAQAAGFDLLDNYQFDIAPLHQAHGLLKAAEFLGVHAIRSSIWKKIEKIRKEPFRYSDAIPLLLTNEAGSNRYQYVLNGVCDMIMDGRIAENERNLMVIRTHYPLFAVELDETLEKRRSARALPIGPWNQARTADLKNELLNTVVSGSEDPLRDALMHVKRSRAASCT